MRLQWSVQEAADIRSADFVTCRGREEMAHMNILFLAKEKPLAKSAAELLTQHFPEARIVFGKGNDPFPKELFDLQFDYIISYISPWIVPGALLEQVRTATVNLHPGPLNYPGIGCTNFAIYNQEKEFGITAHYMLPKVDKGKIIMVKRFPLFTNDTVWSLSQRCYAYIYTTFVELFEYLLRGEPFPVSGETWQREPYTRTQLNDLCRITPDMPDEEIKRRIRATEYPNMPGAYLTLADNVFVYRSESK